MQGEGLRLRAFTSYGICREGLRKSFTELFPRRAATDAARDGGCVWHTGDAHPGRAGCAWSRNAHSAACATFAGGALAEMMRHQHQRKAIEWRAGFISIWTVRWTAVYNTVRLEDLKLRSGRYITRERKRQNWRLCSPDRFDPYLSFWSICT